MARLFFWQKSALARRWLEFIRLESADDFAAEFAVMAEFLQDELLAHAMLLRDFGPGLGRPMWIR